MSTHQGPKNPANYSHLEYGFALRSLQVKPTLPLFNHTSFQLHYSILGIQQ